MVAVSIVLNRLYYPTPYAFGRMAEYVVVALVLFVVGEAVVFDEVYARYTFGGLLFVIYLIYAVWREKIDVKGLVRSMIKRR